MMSSLPMAEVTSWAVTPLAVMAWVSRSTLIRRDMPPSVGENAAPRMVTNCGRTILLTVSTILEMGSVSLLIVSWTMGTSEASYCMIEGGVMPWGILAMTA